MQNDPAPTTGLFDRVRLHFLRWPADGVEPSAAWLMELTDVRWEAPENWLAEIELAVARPGRAGRAVTFRVSEDVQSVVLDFTASTDNGTALAIADRGHVSSLLEAWAKPRDPSDTGDDHLISNSVAEDRVLLLLNSHFATDAEMVVSVDVEYEPGREWLVHVDTDTSRYVGTVMQQGRLQVSHVTTRVDHY
jgi:hypothetical protein